jgi:hypothetical protein
LRRRGEAAGAGIRHDLFLADERAATNEQ